MSSSNSSNLHFAYMDSEKLVAYHVNGSNIKKFEVANFKLQGLKNVKDFTYYDNQIEILMPNQVVIYTYSTNSESSLSWYIKAEKSDGTGEGVKERSDLNMMAFWRLAVTNSSASDARNKMRVLVNGIKELTFIEDWEDNSPTSLHEALYKPQGLKCQTNEIVIKTTTDKSDYYTFYVLKDKEALLGKNSENNRLLLTG